MDQDVRSQIEQAQKAVQAPPADAALQSRLEQDLQGAEEAMERHSMELDRARRVAGACRAGLEQLMQEKMAADRDPDGSRY